MRDVELKKTGKEMKEEKKMEVIRRSDRGRRRKRKGK